MKIVPVEWIVDEIDDLFYYKLHRMGFARKAPNRLGPGSPLRQTWGLAAGGGAPVFLIGLVLLISPAPNQLAATMVIVSGFAAVGIVKRIFKVIQCNQRRDPFLSMAAVTPPEGWSDVGVGVPRSDRCRNLLHSR